MSTLTTPTNKVCFLASAGYFKARHRFFARQFHQADIEFIAKQIGVNPDDVQPNTYHKETVSIRPAPLLTSSAVQDCFKISSQWV